MLLHELEGYDVLVRQFVELFPPGQVLSAYTPEQVLAAYAPEQRLAGLTPEQRLVGITPERVLLTMPDDVLRALSADYLDTLTEATRAAIRMRIGR